MDLADVARKLNQMGDQLNGALADGIQKTATRVRTNAVKRLGHYQPGWAKLKDKTIQRKFGKNRTATLRMLNGKIPTKRGPMSMREMGGLYDDGLLSSKDLRATGTDSDAPLVDDGILRASITIKMDRRRLQAEIGSPMIQTATHEFGDDSRGIPARPFLRPAHREEIKHLQDDLKDAIERRIGR